MPLTRLRTAGAALAVGTAVAVSSCSGSSLPVSKHSPQVHGKHKHLTYAVAHLPRSQWPDPCSLLSRSAGQAALGTTVSVRRFHTSCYYQPGSAEYPTLTITLLAVGTASSGSYRATSESNESNKSNKGSDRTTIEHVGIAAYLHPVRRLPATRLDVLTRYAHLAITEQSPAGVTISPGRARKLLVTVGRRVARVFRG